MSLYPLSPNFPMLQKNLMQSLDILTNTIRGENTKLENTFKVFCSKLLTRCFIQLDLLIKKTLLVESLNSQPRFCRKLSAETFSQTRVSSKNIF